MHTPGPWKVHTKKNGTLGIDAKEPDGSYCQPARVNGDPEDKVYGPTTRANARLIAAAPDLLKKCQQIVAWLDKLARHSEGQAATTRFETMREACLADAKNYRATAKDVQAAIAKATGGNSPAEWSGR